jgi:hypothetical protein
MSWKLHRPKATPQSIKPYRHTHDEVGALTFPLLVLAMDVDQGPSPLMISLSREFGNGLLLAQSSDAYGEALEVLRVVFPEYRDAAIVGAELASSADLFALRREMESGGVSTKGFYHQLRWPGPKWFFSPWADVRQARQFGQG